MTRQTLSLFDHIDRTWHNHTVGFDRAFEVLQHAANVARTNDNFPPYSLVKKDDFNYELEMAVAGFNQKDLEIVASKNRLSVVGMKPEKDEREYIVKGIAGRSFAREFVLADTIVVREVNLTDGILTIHLENVVPEEQKPRKIPIGKQAIGSKAELLVEEDK
ncbi:Hsp20 family protein [bacterium]|nr:Hsp20 family protein [bacterium]